MEAGGRVQSLLTELQSKMAAGGRVQRGKSQHCNPRWRLEAVYSLLTALQSKMAAGGRVQSAHGTAIQDGGWGPCAERLLRALTFGVLSSTAPFGRRRTLPASPPSLPH